MLGGSTAVRINTQHNRGGFEVDYTRNLKAGLVPSAAGSQLGMGSSRYCRFGLLLGCI